MCGIAGYVVSRGSFTVDPLLPMLDSIRHRGPDSGGTWIDATAGVALGHRRLSIVDLSPAGHQPMVSACGRYVITFNGEIYNHRELRKRLDQSGSAPTGGWRGHSDTETLLAAIAAWGLTKALQASVGMFALALWDTKEKTLTLSRDRIGEKPLYFGWQRDVFLFASELKAIGKHPSFLDEINWNSASTFLRLNFIPAPSTIYRGLFKLLPGCLLTVSARDFQSRNLPTPEAYWSLADAALLGSERRFSGGFRDVVESLDLLLGQVIRDQSIADVPLGAFLSGGIDSSLVVAKIQEQSRSPVTTFSIGMPEAAMDESVHAAAVARHLGTDHVAHTIRPSEALDLISQLPKVWDEPLADSSQIPTYLVSRIARRKVTVALSGDGGDEFFLGYNLYPFYQNLWKWRGLGLMPWGAMLRLISPMTRFDRVKLAARRAGSVVSAWRQTDPQMLARFWFDRYRGGRVPINEQREVELIQLPRLLGVAETAGLWDAGTYLPDDILTKVDRASMANSLETRAPLLDHRVIEFALTLPENFKVAGNTRKKILREALYRHVPRALVDRPKVGFSIPLAEWLRKELREWAQDVLGEVRVGPEVFDQQMVDRIWLEHLSGKDHTEKLWGILSLTAFIRGRRR